MTMIKSSKGKRIIAIILILAMLLPMGVFAAETGFKDMGGHWAIEYVNWSAAQKLVKGYPDGNYKPEKTITRAEFYTFINRFVTNGEWKVDPLFTDVKAQDWFYPEIQKAVAYGYILNEKRDLKPNDPISRGEAAMILRYVYGFSANAEPAKRYGDFNKMNEEVAKAVGACTEKGLINGYEDGTYKADAPLKRGEIAKLFYIADKNYGRPRIDLSDRTNKKALEEAAIAYQDNPEVLKKIKDALKDKGLTQPEIDALVLEAAKEYGKTQGEKTDGEKEHDEKPYFYDPRRSSYHPIPTPQPGPEPKPGGEDKPVVPGDKEPKQRWKKSSNKYKDGIYYGYAHGRYPVPTRVHLVIKDGKPVEYGLDSYGDTPGEHEYLIRSRSIPYAMKNAEHIDDLVKHVRLVVNAPFMNMQYKGLGNKFALLRHILGYRGDELNQELMDYFNGDHSGHISGATEYNKHVSVHAREFMNDEYKLERKGEVLRPVPVGTPKTPYKEDDFKANNPKVYQSVKDGDFKVRKAYPAMEGLVPGTAISSATTKSELPSSEPEKYYAPVNSYYPPETVEVHSQATFSPGGAALAVQEALKASEEAQKAYPGQVLLNPEDFALTEEEKNQETLDLGDLTGTAAVTVKNGKVGGKVTLTIGKNKLSKFKATLNTENFTVLGAGTKVYVTDVIRKDQGKKVELILGGVLPKGYSDDTTFVITAIDSITDHKVTPAFQGVKIVASANSEKVALNSYKETPGGYPRSGERSSATSNETATLMAVKGAPYELFVYMNRGEKGPQFEAAFKKDGFVSVNGKKVEGVISDVKDGELKINLGKNAFDHVRDWEYGEIYVHVGEESPMTQMPILVMPKGTSVEFKNVQGIMNATHNLKWEGTKLTGKVTFTLKEGPYRFNKDLLEKGRVRYANNFELIHVSGLPEGYYFDTETYKDVTISNDCKTLSIGLEGSLKKSVPKQENGKYVDFLSEEETVVPEYVKPIFSVSYKFIEGYFHPQNKGEYKWGINWRSNGGFEAQVLLLKDQPVSEDLALMDMGGLAGGANPDVKPIVPKYEDGKYKMAVAQYEGLQKTLKDRFFKDDGTLDVDTSAAWLDGKRTNDVKVTEGEGKLFLEVTTSELKDGWHKVVLEKAGVPGTTIDFEVSKLPNDGYTLSFLDFEPLLSEGGKLSEMTWPSERYNFNVKYFDQDKWKGGKQMGFRDPKIMELEEIRTRLSLVLTDRSQAPEATFKDVTFMRWVNSKNVPSTLNVAKIPMNGDKINLKPGTYTVKVVFDAPNGQKYYTDLQDYTLTVKKGTPPASGSIFKNVVVSMHPYTRNLWEWDPSKHSMQENRTFGNRIYFFDNHGTPDNDEDDSLLEDSKVKVIAVLTQVGGGNGELKRYEFKPSDQRTRVEFSDFPETVDRVHLKYIFVNKENEKDTKEFEEPKDIILLGRKPAPVANSIFKEMFWSMNTGYSNLYKLKKSRPGQMEKKFMERMYFYKNIEKASAEDPSGWFDQGEITIQAEIYKNGVLEKRVNIDHPEDKNLSKAAIDTNGYNVKDKLRIKYVFTNVKNSRDTKTWEEPQDILIVD